MQITVLTDPPFKLYYFLKWLKFKLKHKNIPKYGGHHAVTRSVVEGLQKIGVDVNYNPSFFKTHKIVYVPGGINGLKYAIFLKKFGFIKYLIAGPNLFISPSENKIIKNKELDIIIVNSVWVKDFFIENEPKLLNKIKILPAGVDANFWMPDGNKKNNKNILIYYKRPTKKLFFELKQFLENKNFNVETIYCGNYTIDRYKQALNRNYCLIHLVEQESQGLSLSESWSMNVPTFVWNPGIFYWDGKNYDASSAPYLNESTGKFFINLQNFIEIYNQNYLENKFAPREWLLNNLSDEKCAEKLLSIINSLVNSKI